MPMTLQPVQFSDESAPTLRALRPSAPSLRPGDAVDVRISERPERWRTTRIAAVGAHTVHVMGLAAPTRTGLVCPWCGEPVGQLDVTERNVEAYCQGCGHEWAHATRIVRTPIVGQPRV